MPKSNKQYLKDALAEIPSVIKAKNIVSSRGLLTGFLNLTIDKAPIIPKDNAMLLAIVVVIIKVMFGRSAYVTR